MDHSERDRNYHDVVARQYDRVVLRPRAFFVDVLFEGFLEQFGQRDRLLDLGCGTGHMLARYGRAFRSAVGVDHSPGMLREAQAKLQRGGLSNVFLLRSDLFAFCSEAVSQFDAITCVGVLHHLTASGRAELLRGMSRLCGPQGRMLLAEPVITTPAPAAVREWNRLALGRVQPFEGNLPPDPDEAPLDEATWRAEVNAAGFEVIAENRMWELSTTREFPLAQEREALRWLVAQHDGGDTLVLLLGHAVRSSGAQSPGVRSPSVRSDDEGADTLLARANELAASHPLEAAKFYARVLELDSANLTAHNALEQMGAPARYSRWMHVNCVIDPRDDIFRWFTTHPLSKNPIREYLADGWRTMSELTLLLERLDRPLLKMSNVLEYAAGFGRFTRHLVRAMPGRVTCTDVQAGSVEFLRQQFGVEAFYSSMKPSKVALPARYDLIFVLSMFTHLPAERWTAWLKHLHRALKPGGLLIFSVHNEMAAREQGITFDQRGTHFLRSSESPRLGGDNYGTTFTTDEFVASQVELALGREPLLHERLAFWVGQDAIVVGA